MIVQHRKGEPAGGRDLGMAGYCKSFWAEDGWHDTATGNVVPAPTEAEIELLAAKQLLKDILHEMHTEDPNLSLLRWSKRINEVL